jgi:hypothetical protein
LDKPPLRIEGRAVAFAGILAQQLGFFTWLDAIEFRLPYIDEILEPVRMIERPFGKGETGIEPLRVTIDQVVERGHVDLLDLVRLVGVPLGVVARFQRVVERTVGRHVGPQLASSSR